MRGKDNDEVTFVVRGQFDKLIAKAIELHRAANAID